MKRLLKSFLTNYQNEQKILRNGSNFVFKSVDLFSDHIHKTKLKTGKSQIKPPEWILNKRATINPKNKGNKCFQYSITAALNHKTLKTIQKEYQILNPLLISIIWKVQIFRVE